MSIVYNLIQEKKLCIRRNDVSKILLKFRNKPDNIEIRLVWYENIIEKKYTRRGNLIAHFLSLTT